MRRRTFESVAQTSIRALALLHAGRAVTAFYANAVVAMNQARKEDFAKLLMVDGNKHLATRYAWTAAAVEELVAYRQLSEQVAAERKGVRP